jgi:hypothetical protein
VDVTESGHVGDHLRASVTIYDHRNRLSNGKVDGGVMGDRTFRYDCGAPNFWAEVRRPFLWSPWSGKSEGSSKSGARAYKLLAFRIMMSAIHASHDSCGINHRMIFMIRWVAAGVCLGWRGWWTG